ncbi:hypothetical protein [Streptomyces sp. NBC_01462]|uniref:hypothetical protein n=1 Tax=Streptomyces sp. NBC_01462 TaxID=2903876 RepID=UPI002E35B5A7|nr:hypothetical protein [Streptomyces sp. NBC_01462]
MMPDHTPGRHACRKDHTKNSSTPTKTSPRPAAQHFELITQREAQEIRSTASRQLRRANDFLAAARYMVRHHPQAGATTIRLATAFAARMHRSRHGHVAFNLDATVRELGVSRRTILNHARYLRELGLIAWVEHGSKHNVVRTRRGNAFGPGDGYRGTATIYAPVAPPDFDRRQGHRVRGTGYRARLIGYTDKGRARALAAVRSRARRARTAPGRRCTPSVVVTSAPSHLQVVTGEKKNTRRSRQQTGARRWPRTPFTAGECQQAIALTEQVQREVWWLYTACSRRLAHALRPLIAAGWSAVQLAAELATWGVPAYLKDAAAYVRHELRRRQERAELPPAEPAVRDLPGDDGSRYEAMLRERATKASAFWRYAEQTRPALRNELARRRRHRREQEPPHVYRPLLREPEEDFLASLPAETWADTPTPRDIYRARALGQQPGHGRDVATADSEWLRHLHEHAAAARACDALRERWSEEWQQDSIADIGREADPR